jgi:hypothetical protein
VILVDSKDDDISINKIIRFYKTFSLLTSIELFERFSCSRLSSCPISSGIDDSLLCASVNFFIFLNVTFLKN